MDQGGLASFSPDGTRVAYNQIFRNFRTGSVTPEALPGHHIYDLKNNTVDTKVPHTDWVILSPCGRATRSISI